MSRVLRATRTDGRSAEPISLDLPCNGKPNSITTTRFTLASWLPKSIWIQFHRAANIYFLCVSIIVCLDFSPIQWSSTVLPFTCVLLWTALKDLYEDFRRRRDDDAENLRRCWRWDFASKQFMKVRWRDVLCGDIVVCLQDEAFPADMLVLYAVGGQAFISTVNLDGETNLKERRAANALSAVTEGHDGEVEGARRIRLSKEPSKLEKDSAFAEVLSTAGRMAELLLSQGLEVSLGEPKAGLTEMDGSITLTSPSPEADRALRTLEVSLPGVVRYEHFVPRGCVLRNSPYIIAMAAYVGGDTKTRLNCAPTEAKISNMQVYLNKGVQGLVLTLVVFNVYIALLSMVMDPPTPATWPDSWPEPVVRFIVYWIILYQIVPISLYVLFEIIKLILGFKIGQDPQMVDPRTGVPALARTADLVEEMGQVNFVFSDKTGTLTENEMVFARCCVFGRDLGDFRAAGSSTEDARDPEGVAETRRLLLSSDSAESGMSAAVRWFFLCMATCHTAQVDVSPAVGDQKESFVFSGSSPDEVAFLEIAHAVGVTFLSRKRVAGKSGWEVTLRGAATAGGAGGRSDSSTAHELDSTAFEVLAEIPFDSDRKRMTVVCRHRDEIWVISKGADNVMQTLCNRSFSEPDLEQLVRYSRLGLRTLVFASKRLDKSFFETWQQRWVSAEALSEGRDQALARAAAEVECHLELVGISAIEDRLQEGVPEAITSIKAAGIRFWVLTGDKTETAVEVVRACRLFVDEMPLASLVNCRDTRHALELLEAAKGALGSQGTGGLVIDGTFVAAVLASEEGALQLYELAVQTRACVCCRLSPQQKRKLVELVKEHHSMGITLAIGDGANDVSMIQGAHVGIGIRGKEGSQAVQASDVAISQFRFLVPLLLCHGRRAYRRVSVFLCYVLYKHIALAVGDAIWAHQCSIRFYGQIAYPEWLSSAFPALLTGLPVIVALGFDQDLPDEVVLQCPEIYKEGIERVHFNQRVFVCWVLTAMWHGAVSWLVPSLWVGTDSPLAHTPPLYEPREFWVASCISFTVLIVFLNARLMLYSYSPFSKQTLGIVAFSFFCLIFCLVGLSALTPGIAMQPQLEGVLGTMFSETRYLVVLVVTPLIFAFDILAVAAWVQRRPAPIDLVRRRYFAGEFDVPPAGSASVPPLAGKDTPGHAQPPEARR